MTEILPVRTYIRINPNNNTLSFTSTSVQVVTDTTTLQYTFDKVFGPQSTQKQIYKEIQPIITEFLSGQNATIFCYGSTGSGKTYTMTGSKVESQKGESYGLVQHIASSLIKENKLLISYLEIYNEKIYDLLDQKEIYMRDYEGKVYLPNLETRLVSTFDEFIALFGSVNRRVGATNLNQHSSRSHAILRIMIGEHKLHLIDLAGSENNRKSGNEGIRLAESSSINSSLFVLGKVVNAILRKDSRIPYRDSKLTRLLQDSLGGSCVCCIIANIIGDASGDTINTLKFASKSKSIVNKKYDQIKSKNEVYIPGSKRIDTDRRNNADKLVDTNKKLQARREKLVLGRFKRDGNPQKAKSQPHRYVSARQATPITKDVDIADQPNEYYCDERASVSIGQRTKFVFMEKTNARSDTVCYSAHKIHTTEAKDSSLKNEAHLSPDPENICVPQAHRVSPSSSGSTSYEKLHTRPTRKTQNDTSLLKASFIDKPDLLLSPTTREKSYKAFLKRAEDFELQQDYKSALADYKIIQKFSDTEHVKNKIAVLNELIRHSRVKVNLSELDILYVLNSGSLLDIKKLPKFGDKRAKAVVDFVNGGNFFESLNDLKLIFSEKIVKGILDSIR